MKTELDKSVKNAIDYIISNENFEDNPEIVVTSGSETGDGYASKTYAVSINGKSGKSLNLFVKCLPEQVSDAWIDAMKEAFQAEFHFYNDIYPVFSRFERNRNIENPFCHVAKHFRTNIDNCVVPPILLENLRCLGYTLRDRKKPADKNHLVLPIKAFAKLHAISFAMKDQEHEGYKKIFPESRDYLIENLRKFGFDKMLDTCISQFLDALDPVKDKMFFDHCTNLPDVLMKFMETIPNEIDEYTVFSQGDCWSNNMMFLYDEKSGAPIDVKLIDWQCRRVSSPLLDFSHFFYTLAAKEHLDNTDYYLNLYYETLSQRIKELGSDPNKVFPYVIFLEHWKKFALFGLCMALIVIKGQLLEKDEAPDLMNSENGLVDAFAPIFKNQDQYISRIKDVIGYFIDIGFI